MRSVCQSGSEGVENRSEREREMEGRALTLRSPAGGGV